MLRRSSPVAERARARGIAGDGAAEGPFTAAVGAAAAHAYAARTPSFLAMAQIDDLWAGETVAVNLPGTDRERPNWRRKLAGELSNLLENDFARAILESLRRNVD